MTLNLAVLASSTFLALGGAIAFSYQPPLELKSNPYTSIQEAVQPSAHPLLKGVGMMMIGGAAIGGLYAYQPNKRKSEPEVDEPVNDSIQQEEIPWQISEPKKEEDVPTDITERSFGKSSKKSPPTDGSLRQPTSQNPIDLWSDEREDLSAITLKDKDTKPATTKIKAQGIGFDEEPEPFSETEKIFHTRSAIIAGCSGSGKSSAMRYLLGKRLEARPDTRLLIIDPHYDPDGEMWLPGCSQEEHNQIVIRGGFKGLSAFRKVFEEGLRREELNLKKEPPLLVVIDEYQGFVNRTESSKEMSEMITYIQNGFRKFHVDIFLGLHSLKKGECGLDSSATIQMHWYILGNLINDTNTVVPDNWDRKKLHRERISLGKYAAIVCREGCDPFVTDTPDFSLLQSNQDPEIDDQEKSNVIPFKRKGA